MNRIVGAKKDARASGSIHTTLCERAAITCAAQCPRNPLHFADSRSPSQRDMARIKDRRKISPLFRPTAYKRTIRTKSFDQDSQSDSSVGRQNPVVPQFQTEASPWHMLALELWRNKVSVLLALVSCRCFFSILAWENERIKAAYGPPGTLAPTFSPRKLP